MKGKEIMSYIHRDKMPNSKQVLRNCVGQTARDSAVGIDIADTGMGVSAPVTKGMKRDYKRKRFSRLATNAAAFLAFAIVALVAWSAYTRFEEGGFSALLPSSSEPATEFDRVYLGYGIGLVFVPEDYHTSECVTVFGVTIYVNINAETAPFFRHNGWIFNESDAAEIRQMTEGMFFTADGMPICLFIERSINGFYYISSGFRNAPLYDTYGNDIGAIRFIFPIEQENTGNLVPIRIETSTIDEWDASFGRFSSIEEVSSFMAVNIPLLEGFNPPIMWMSENIQDIPDVINGGHITIEFKGVGAHYHCIKEPFLSVLAFSAMDIERDVNEPFWVSLYLFDYNEIREYTIEGATVVFFKCIERDFNRYIWVYNGLYIELYVPKDFPSYKAHDIITQFISYQN